MQPKHSFTYSFDYVKRFWAFHNYVANINILFDLEIFTEFHNEISQQREEMRGEKRKIG